MCKAENTLPATSFSFSFLTTLSSSSVLAFSPLVSFHLSIIFRAFSRSCQSSSAFNLAAALLGGAGPSVSSSSSAVSPRPFPTSLHAFTAETLSKYVLIDVCRRTSAQIKHSHGCTVQRWWPLCVLLVSIFRPSYILYDGSFRTKRYFSLLIEPEECVYEYHTCLVTSVGTFVGGLDLAGSNVTFLAVYLTHLGLQCAHTVEMS